MSTGCWQPRGAVKAVGLVDEATCDGTALVVLAMGVVEQGCIACAAHTELLQAGAWGLDGQAHGGAHG